MQRLVDKFTLNIIVNYIDIFLFIHDAALAALSCSIHDMDVIAILLRHLQVEKYLPKNFNQMSNLKTLSGQIY